jgi:hypothetical protein
MTAKKRSLDIFKTLTHISNKDRGYYEALPDDVKKELQPFVVMRWLTGTSDPRQIYFINEIVNRFVFELGSHKPLLYKLLCVATSGQPQRYQWKKPASRKGAGTMCTQVVKQYYHYNTRQATEALGLLSNDDIMGYAEEIGLQKEDIAKLKRELKTRSG